MTNRVYVERALFMIGDQGTGKSTQLRSMFQDWRLGTWGDIPKARNPRNAYALSNERWLYLRMTSPDETNEDMARFLEKCEKNMRKRKKTGWPKRWLARRWNFAGALQHPGNKKLQGPANVLSYFESRFKPERIRAVVLSPDCHDNRMEPAELRSLIKSLRNVRNTEVIMVDATAREENGLIYADFFDFT